MPTAPGSNNCVGVVPRRGEMSALQRWCVRTCAIFAAVYVLGIFHVPTQIPYIAALLLAAADAWRVWRTRD